MSRTSNRYKAVLGVIGSDCHAVGNQIIAKTLDANGIEVFNLGVMVSQDEFIDTAIETNADVILVSSIYGHGEIDCFGMRARCIERGLTDILIYVGGNLVIGKRPFSEVREIFNNMGFDRVYSPTVELLDMIKDLERDIYEQTIATNNFSMIKGSSISTSNSLHTS